MAVHVAILKPHYIRLILGGVKTVESRLTRTPLAPFRKIAPGDVIFFKASGGPYMAGAVAGAVEFHENLSVAALRGLYRKHHAAVCGDAAYWRAKRSSRYATFVTLAQVRATAQGPKMPPSRGLAWFVLPDDAAATMHSSRGGDSKEATVAESFEVVLSPGAVRNGYVAVAPAVHRFPAACYGDTRTRGEPIELLLPDGTKTTSDLLKGVGRFRWRGWGRLFRTHSITAGDKVRFTAIDARRFRVEFIRASGSAASSDISNKPPLRLKAGPSERAATVRERSSQKVPANTDHSLTVTARSETQPIPAPPRLDDFVTRRELTALIRAARAEDLGTPPRDLTSELFIDAKAKGRAVFRARQAGRLCGGALLPSVAAIYDRRLNATVKLMDGAKLTPGAEIAVIEGPLRSLLGVERVALNFMTHLSGIASAAAKFVDAVAGTRAGIHDTRKTIPGLRKLEKYAVVCGGGRSHRMGLYDAVLVKDNHIAHLALEELPAALGSMLAKARAARPAPKFVMVEVDSLAQLEKVLPVGPDIVLLDNMNPATLREAVAMRDRLAPGVELEASGGVRIETVRGIAETGVDRISAGSLTHSAPALDIGLDIEA